MSKLAVIIIFSYLFSGYLLASTQQVDSANTARINVGLGTTAKASRHASKIVTRAHELIGTPYRWGGASVSKGFDCSGLLVYLFRSEAGIRIPRTTSSMLNSKSKTIARHNLKSGDIIFFKHNGRDRMNHAGVYIGSNRFIHAPRAGKSVRIDSLNNNYWDKSYFVSKRFH